MLELNWRWMEKLKLLVSGRRVASLPCHQDTLSVRDRRIDERRRRLGWESLVQQESWA